ncbi:hypothetical protein TRV_05999 [Trichophyton verrucosum HKI 0517]|uniref:Uncharacterized protein n=1 Tax=Trichophyton verrucosum (strain HKI 0517) TaxID=663202 RepID=D4DFP8_TRIVH|nr:uncharacterized protein TRV_05999 [Trichophyton verrucosum HKI 0517]EFE39329.1 hypothetical protein TRV_05999 [Trichophyton verrucosum HKI 0517]
MPITLPSSRAEWLKHVDDHGVVFQPIHNLDSLKSGSKIGEHQFLALRVLWKRYKAGTFNYNNWDLSLEAAKLNLGGMSIWKEYYHTLQTTGLGDKPKFGRFDMLWSFQKQVARLPGDSQNDSDKIASPVSSRTRQAMASRQTLASNLPSSSSDPFSTPGRSIGQPQSYNFPSRLDAYPLASRSRPQTPTNRGMNMSVLDDDEEGSPMVIDDLSPAAAGEGYQFPPADDEQTVNTALILALNAVCLSQQSLVDFPWTLERKAFVFKTPTRKLYEARTDGHLRFRTDKMDISLAILEVKAGVRDVALPHAQESAQMAAWINAEPDMVKQTGTRYRILKNWETQRQGVYDYA